MLVSLLKFSSINSFQTLTNSNSPLLQCLSPVFGTFSLICWLIVFTPQIYENYSAKSAKSISLYFVGLWLVGDLFNLVGAVIQHLLSTQILLAGYFILFDLVIIGQIVYYDGFFKSYFNKNHESQPLLQTAQIPNYQYINSEQAKSNHNYSDVKAFLSKKSKNILIITFSFTLIGYIYYNAEIPSYLYYLNYLNFGEWCGWISCVIYLLSRMPQIYHNFKRQSTKGLSMLMFTFCVIGNVSFAMSILSYSNETEYIEKNLPWILGGVLTLLMDFVIFVQHFYFKYRNNAKSILDQEV